MRAWSKGRQSPGTVLHSSHELGDLPQSFKHEDSTIRIILVLLSLLLLLLYNNTIVLALLTKDSLLCAAGASKLSASQSIHSHSYMQTRFKGTTQLAHPMQSVSLNN